MFLFLVVIPINFIVAAFLYPELFVRVDLRMVQGHETCGPMQYVFYLIGQFYQGGVQLFDRYDLLHGGFTQLSVGLYTPINYLIALGYVLLSPFVPNDAQFFHHWYVLAYYGFGVILRTFGLYLMAFYMTKSRWIALITTVLVNSFCAITQIHLGGLCISEVYNYFPLLLFCLVYYWETRAFKAVVASVLIFLLAANNSMYVGLGYFYQTLHLFLFDMLMIWLIFQRGRKPLLADRFDWRTVLKVFIGSALVLLPVWWWSHAIISDLEMIGSGLGESHGRFNRILNPAAMINDPMRYFVSTADVFRFSYDYTISNWYTNGAFLGITTLVLSVIGLILGKHSYKFVFITAAVMMAFLNVPSTQGGWMTWAHWVDTVTNPFCFLVRSFHYSVLIWYITLAIPMCLGVQACLAIIQGQRQTIFAERINFVKGALAGILCACLFISNPAIKLYALKVLGLFFIFFVVADIQRLTVSLRARIAVVLFLVLGVIEFGVLKHYINIKSEDMNGAYWDGQRIKPRIFEPMYTPPVPMILDYQNPKILPVRFFYRTDSQVVWPLLWEFQGLFGQFYQYMPLALRMERPGNMYVPRMKIFQDIDKDKQMQEYIRRDGRVMYVADAGIPADKEFYDKVLASGLDRRVVMVEEAHTDKLQDIRSLTLPQALPLNFKSNDYTFKPEQARVRNKKEGIQYQWPLEKKFPRYLSTTVLTPDVQLWQLAIGGNALIPAQGALVHPGTFDVNNIRKGYLTVLMPPDFKIDQQDVTLKVFTPAELVDVWRNTHDQFGFTYNNPRDGWWVIHMPYNSKWTLTIDGVKTPLSKINRYFIGAPLPAGEHKILLSYWSGTPLRFLIVVSTLVAIGMMFLVFYWTYRWHKDGSVKL